MSRAKTTKRAKRYSAQHLYRHFTELSNHAKKAVQSVPAQPTTQPPGANQMTKILYLWRTNRTGFWLVSTLIFNLALTITMLALGGKYL